MAVKNVGLAEDAYNLLAAQKKPGELLQRGSPPRRPAEPVGLRGDVGRHPGRGEPELKADLKEARRTSDLKLAKKLARR